jgi:hypothetical protein
MGITRAEYDRLVRKRKKCRPGDPCFTRQGDQGAPQPPVAKDPTEISKFKFPANRTPSSMFTSAQNVGDYTKRLSDLSNEIAGVQMDLMDYQNRIAGGSHEGLGHFIEQGNSIVGNLQALHDRTSHQRTMHSHLNLDDLKMLYQHVVAATNTKGIAHPPNHPIDLSGVTSRTALIEAMTTDYGYEPMSLLQYYHGLTNPTTSP